MDGIFHLIFYSILFHFWFYFNHWKWDLIVLINKNNTGLEDKIDQLYNIFKVLPRYWNQHIHHNFVIWLLTQNHIVTDTQPLWQLALVSSTTKGDVCMYSILINFLTWIFYYEYWYHRIEGFAFRHSSVLKQPSAVRCFFYHIPVCSAPPLWRVEM